MAQTANELNSLSVGAKHTTAGVPANCDLVREHFYRVALANVGTPAVRGVHHSGLTSSGFCSAASGAADSAVGCSAGATATNLTNYDPTADEALKVSWMITDSDSGLEMGDNAVHIERFSDQAMMTNQQPLSFGTDGKLNYDP